MFISYSVRSFSSDLSKSATVVELEINGRKGKTISPQVMVRSFSRSQVTLPAFRESLIFDSDTMMGHESWQQCFNVVLEWKE